MMRAGAALAVAAAIAATTGVSRAEEPPVGPSVGLGVAYGYQLGAAETGGVSAYGFGFGARAGTTLRSHLYLGGDFVAHVGTNEAARGDGGALYEARYHDAYFGPEVGYDVNVGHWLFRPTLGVGMLVAFGKTVVGRVTFGDDNAFLYVAPGVLVAYGFDAWLVGVDLRMPLTPAQSSDAWAPSAGLSVGMRL